MLGFEASFVTMWLTHWGRVMHICVRKLTIIGSDNGLSSGVCQAIIWSNAGTLLVGPMGTNFLIEIYVFLFKKMPLKLSWGNWRPFCLSLNVLNWARDFPKSMNGWNMLLTQVKEWSGARCHHQAVGITMPFILAQGIIVSDNGLVPNRRQAIIWTNDQGKLSILPWNFHIVTLMRVYVYIFNLTVLWGVFLAEIFILTFLHCNWCICMCTFSIWLQCNFGKTFL